VDRVACLDASTGEVLWSHEYLALIYDNEHGGGAIGTGGVHEGVLYVPTRSGEVRAFDAAGGSVLWEVDLVERHEVGWRSVPGRRALHCARLDAVNRLLAPKSLPAVARRSHADSMNSSFPFCSAAC
jgi:outer membrane protein assembly factor BamB